MTNRQYFLRPLVDDNPIMVQILGLCSALAVSREVEPALIMSASVTAVLVFSNVSVSLLRRVMPRSIRLILEVTLIASAVIVIDELLKAYLPETSRVLSVFVGLIITNCIVLGRADTFALNHNVRASVVDALGNGLGYSVALIFVAVVRELLGAGMLLGRTVLPVVQQGGWYLPNDMMLYAPSAFFILGLMVWGARAWGRWRRPRPVAVPGLRTI